MSNGTQLQVLFGMVSALLLPIIVSYLKNCAWSDTLKSVLSISVALAFGVAGVWIAKGSISFVDVSESVTAIYTASSLIYTVWFKTLPFNTWLEKQKVL